MGSIKVGFFVYPTAFQAPGGGEVQLLKTQEYLGKLGVDVKLFDLWKDKLEDFDIFHVFGSVKDCLEIIRTADILGVKTILSTICWYSWKSAWGIYSSPCERTLSLTRQGAKTFFPYMPSKRKRMMEFADLLCPNSISEARQLERYFCIPKKKIQVVPNGVDPLYAQATPDKFIVKYGIKDFVLCVGRIEPRKNQLNVIRALNHTNLPLVLIGDYVHQYQDYYFQCRREAGKNIHFLGAMPYDSGLLASAYAACNTFVLASWLETPGLAALEAALAGAKIVITDQGATREYFKEYVAYVPPDRVEQIRKTVQKQFDASPQPELKKHVQSNYLWEHVAQKTYEAYQIARDYSPNIRRLKSFSKGARITKIGIDLQSVKGRKTGLGVYTEQLVKAYFDLPKSRYDFRFFSRDKNEELNTLQRWGWENVQLPLKALADQVDILHVPAFSPPAVKFSKMVVTVHDLIGMLFPNQLRWPSAFYWGKWLPFSLKRADAIVADSQNTKNDLMKYLSIPEKKIHVVYLSGHEGFVPNIASAKVSELKAKYGIKEKYLLFVGTLEPRKNLERVIVAFAKTLKDIRQHAFYQLVVVGSKEFGHGKFFQELSKRVGVTLDDVIFTGYVNHEELNALYCGAETFLYPSLYEGFGIPILEAMAAGVPVIASTTTSVPEVAGDAAFLVDPYQTGHIASAMLEMSKNTGLRRELIAKGFERIKAFSWHKTATETIKVYDSLSG